ncbi:dystrophin, isoforms A/C/F/G/H isoform X1 [Halyomorpha halys]|uniref:dystrophin, isoforms A/C/F/G/H isoform X1 n=1 Tax=Halyomorpha halys TaxID=286706 RepID=UPI0034D25CA5
MLLRSRVVWKTIDLDDEEPYQPVDEQIHSSKYEREDVQKKTFAKWINSQLSKCNQHNAINDLVTDLQDGTNLLSLLEILTGKEYKREKGRMRVHKLNNVNRALQILEQNNVKLVNISSNDIVDGNPKLILGLVWSIILHWQVHWSLKELMTDAEQTNLEKTLLMWCKQNTQKYNVEINNFTTSWSDGLAFNALIHNFRPELFDYANVARRQPNARLNHAFKIAQEFLNIERLLDVEDVNTSVPDKKSIMMYVMCLFQSLPHSASGSDSAEGHQMECDNSNSRPLSIATNVSVELGGYQVALEEVLTWLLEAEDRLNMDQPIAETLEEVKLQFNEHEAFINDLYRHREGVGAVLEEGVRMLNEGGLTRDEEEEVRIQMKLLNSRWETLRVNAIQKQSRIYDAVGSLQDEKVNSLRQWMTQIEDRISRMSEVGTNIISLKEQMETHNQLQQDIKKQQSVVDALSQFVVVVDDNSAETHSQIEDQLAALAERWAHICQWAEERGAKLQTMTNKIFELDHSLTSLESWISQQEEMLKNMEAHPVSEIGEILERIKHLQILKHNMDIKYNKLMSLHDNIQELSAIDPDGAKDYLSRWETVSDSWDALTMIMDVQAHRISSSGFEISLTPGVSDKPPLVESTHAWQTPVEQTHEIQELGAQLRRVEHDLTAISNSLNTDTLNLDECNEMLRSLREKEKETRRLCETSTEIANKRPCEETHSLREKSFQFSSLISDMIEKLENEERKLSSSISEKNRMQVDTVEPKTNGIAMEVSASESIEQEMNTVPELSPNEKEALNSILTSVEEMKEWVLSIQGKCNVGEIFINNSVELFKLKAKYQGLKDEVDRKSCEYRLLYNKGNDLINELETHPCAEHLKSDLKELSDLWMEVTNEIFEKHNILQDASHKYGEFRALVSQETVWLDKLEKRLRKSPKSAADAEEISQDLDDLENFVRNHSESRVDRIEEFGQILVKDHVMESSIQNDMKSVVTRWNHLCQEAKDRANILEKSVVEAQQSETNIAKFQDWLSHVHAQIISRMENDLTSDDLPDDVQRLVDEFDKQANTLKDMEDEIKYYEAEGKVEAASRLHEQMVLLRNQFMEVMEKFEDWRCANNVEPRLCRALRELRGVEEASCLLELASDDPEAIQGQLNHCMRFYQMLSDLKGEVENIIKSGRKMVEDKSVPDPEQYTIRLDTLKQLYNKLGEEITVSKSNLERALEVSQDLNMDLNSLQSWVQAVTNDLDQVEATPASDRDIKAELRFVKETIEECKKQETLQGKVQDGYNQFIKFCDPSYLDTLKERMSEAFNKLATIKNRLNQTIEQLEGIGKTVAVVSNKSLKEDKTESNQSDQNFSKDIPTISVTEVNEQADNVNEKKDLSGISNPAFDDGDVEMKSVPRVVNQTNRCSVYENVDYIQTIPEEVETSEEVSSNYSKEKTSDLKKKETGSLERKCQMVEIKTIEITKSCVASLEHAEHTVIEPESVEIVEIIDSGADESDLTDPEDKRSPATVRRVVDPKNRKNLAPGEILAKRQKLASDEALRNSNENLKAKMTIDPNTVTDIEITDVTNSTENNGTVVNSNDITPVCLTISDKINHTEQTKVTVVNKTEKLQADEVMLRKEVQVSKTYELIGNFSTSQELDVPVLEDCDSFYGSDKETDDVVVFSEDEVKIVDDSSDDDVEMVQNSDTTTQGKPAIRMENGIDKYSVMKVHENSPNSPSLPLEQEVAEYEEAASEMMDRMAIMLQTIKGVAKEKDPGRRLEILESELSQLAPDAATLISRGDGLVLKVHCVMPEKALALKTTSQNKLRARWAEVMQQTEAQKLDAQRADVLLIEHHKLITNINTKITNINLKLGQANNDEAKLQEVMVEYGLCEESMSRLFEVTKDLSNLQVVTDSKELAAAWKALSDKFNTLKKSPNLKDKCILMPDKDMMDSPADYIAHVNKVREAISIVARKLKQPPLSTDFDPFHLQEEALKGVKDKLNRLKSEVDKVDQKRNRILRKVSGEGRENVVKAVERLKQEWELANTNLNDRYSHLTKCKEQWESLRKNCEKFADWLSTMEIATKDLDTNKQSALEVKAKLRDLEKQATTKTGVMNRIVGAGRDMVALGGSQAKEMWQTVESLRHRWNHLLTQFKSIRETLGMMQGTKHGAKGAVESATACLDQVKSLLSSQANPSDEAALSVRMSLVKSLQEDLSKKKRELESLQSNGGQTEQLQMLITNINKAQENLSEHKDYLSSKINSLQRLLAQLECVMAWVNEVKTRVNISKELSPAERTRILDNIMTCIYDREAEVKEVKENFNNLDKECRGDMPADLREQIRKLTENWQYLKNRGELTPSKIPVLQSPIMNRQASPLIRRSPALSKKSESELLTSSPSQAVKGNSGSEVRGGSGRLLPPAYSSPRTTLIASLDKSILQIRDWLTLEEDMLRQQTVIVGSVQDILQVLDKQKVSPNACPPSIYIYFLSSMDYIFVSCFLLHFPWLFIRFFCFFP